MSNFVPQIEKNDPYGTNVRAARPQGTQALARTGRMLQQERLAYQLIKE